MTRVVRRTNPASQQDTSPSVDRLIEEYRKSKEFEEACAQRTQLLKEELVAVLKKDGIPDDKGSLWVHTDRFDIKHERRSSNSLRMDAVQEWAEANGVLSEVTETVVSISEEKFLAFAFQHPELIPDISEFYHERVSWAFKSQTKEPQ